MKCYVKIQGRAAIKARNNTVGIVACELDLTKLNDAQLAELEDATVEKKEYPDGIFAALELGEATAAAIVNALDKRIAEAEEDARKEADALEAKIEELRLALAKRDLSERVTQHSCLGEEGRLIEVSPVAPFVYANEKSAIPAELLRELDAWEGECEAANARAQEEINKKLAAHEAAQEAAQEAAKEARAAEQAAWIQAHGSRRLKTMLAEGIKHTAVYMDERLALERPGWQYQSDVGGEFEEPRNIPEEAVDLLEDARKSDPAAKLAYWIEDEDDELEDDKPSRRYVAVSQFLGAETLYTG